MVYDKSGEAAFIQVFFKNSSILSIPIKISLCMLHKPIGGFYLKYAFQVE